MAFGGSLGQDFAITSSYLFVPHLSVCRSTFHHSVGTPVLLFLPSLHSALHLSHHTFAHYGAAHIRCLGAFLLATLGQNDWGRCLRIFGTPMLGSEYKS